MAYLVGHIVGFVLLGIALARARAVRLWAAVAVAVWPFAELAGEASGVHVLAGAGFALLAVGFGVCAVEIARRSPPFPDRAASPSALASTASAGN